MTEEVTMDLEDFRETWMTELALKNSDSQKFQQESTVKSLVDPLQSQSKELPDSVEKMTQALSQTSISLPSSTSSSPSRSRKGKDKEKLKEILKKSVKEEAIDAYVAGSRYERMGNLNEALNSYRVAEKLDANIYTVIRENPQLLRDVKPGQGEDQDFYTYYSFSEDQSGTELIPLDTNRESPSHLHFQVSDPTKGFSIASIPEEILIQILKWRILWDVSSLSTLACVSKKMSVLTKEQSIWRFLCEKVHRDPQRLAMEVKTIYNDNWLHMWLLKSRLRFDGVPSILHLEMISTHLHNKKVYISRVNYVRPGYDEDFNGFNVPVHMVTYYRYLRFIRNGTNDCVMLTTTTEPQQAVKALASPQSIEWNGLLSGSFSWSDDQGMTLEKGRGFSLLLLDPSLPRHQFHGKLTVSSTRKGQFNKISWVEYSSEQILDPENTRTFISKTHLKPFLFSRVKSWKGYC